MIALPLDLQFRQHGQTLRVARPVCGAIGGDGPVVVEVDATQVSRLVPAELARSRGLQPLEPNRMRRVVNALATADAQRLVVAIQHDVAVPFHLLDAVRQEKNSQLPTELRATRHG